MTRPPDPARAVVLAAVDAVRPGVAPPWLVADGPLRRPGRVAARGARARRQAEQRRRTWESRQRWIGVAPGRERALVVVAVELAGRIAASRAWVSPQWEIHRVRLDLTVELDEVDDLAYRLATGAGDPAWVEATWASLLDRVCALHAYADELTGLDRTPAPRDEDVPTELAAAQVRAEQGAEHLRALTAELRDRT